MLLNTIGIYLNIRSKVRVGEFLYTGYCNSDVSNNLIGSMERRTTWNTTQ